jgi:MFS family permease
MMLASTSIILYSVDYLATYAQDSLHLTPSQGLAAIIVVGACTVAFDPLAGILSDRLGRRPVALAAAVALAATAVPALHFMVQGGGLGVFYGCTAGLAALSSLAVGPTLITVAESLPTRARARALGTMYAVAVAIFGGTTQVVVKWLIDVTESPLAPSFYLTGAVLVGILAMALSRETAPSKLAE